MELIDSPFNPAIMNSVSSVICLNLPANIAQLIFSVTEIRLFLYNSRGEMLGEIGMLAQWPDL